MKKILITYQLDNNSADYQNVKNYISTFEKWAKIFDRTWVIRTTKKPSEIRSELATAINKKGKVFVVDITSSAWGSYNIETEVASFLKSIE